MTMPKSIFVLVFLLPHLASSFCPPRCVCVQEGEIGVECILAGLEVRFFVFLVY
jgi:hypothetical protein